MPNFLERAKNAVRAFSYDAVSEKGRRRPPSNTLAAEHVILPDSKRKKMLATNQDQQRNASLAAWMVRRHLDYVSRFRFQFRTGNEPLDKLVNRIFDWHGRPRNFDIAARMGREEMFRMFEAEKVVAGDAAMLRLANLKMQAIESDMLAYPRTGKMKQGKRDEYEALDEKVVGLVDKETGALMSLDAPGAVAKWCVCNRGWNGKSVSFDQLVDSSNVSFDGYFTRFSSQVRGVSPLSTAINSIQDLYEGVEWNLLKAKIHAIFGVAIMRDYAGAGTDQEEVGMLGGAAGIATGADEQLKNAATSPDGTKAISSSLQKLTPDSIMMVDMEAKGRIELLESRTPSNEFQTFNEAVMRLCMLALDIPYTAFDSKASSFSGMIADQNFYEVSCRWKRDKNKWVRQDYSDWVLAAAWNDPAQQWGLKAIAEAAGFSRLRDLQESVEWIPAGAPWLQKLQEIMGDCRAIAANIDNVQDVCKRRGGDFFENVIKNSEAYKFAKANGVPIMIGDSGQATVEEAIMAGEPSAETPPPPPADQGKKQ